MKRIIAVVLGAGTLLVVPQLWAELPVTPEAGSSTGRASRINVPAPAGGSAKSSSPATAVPQDGDVLKFRNGDSLHGTVMTVVPGTGLRWRRSDVKEPVGFDLANVVELQLSARPPRTSRTAHHTVIELTNGDRLAGDIVSLNDKVLVLNTWYAGTLSVKRPMIQRITFGASSNPEAVFIGPTGLDGWTQEGNRGAWSYKKGALYGRQNGSVARDVKLPDVANIEFDVAWLGQLSMQFAFYIDDLRQLYNAGGYMMQFNYSNVYLQRSRPQRGFNQLGTNVDVPDFQRKTKGHISVRVNKPKKTIALFVNGNLVKQWTDPGEFAGKGTGIMFFAQGQGQLRVSNISVTSWDGKLDTDAVATAASAPVEDLVRFANNDKVSGNLTGIANNEIAFATSFAGMKIPLERVAQIELAGQKAEQARRQANDARAYFLDGSRFTLALEKLDDQSLVGTSENCGRVTSSLDAFRRVQFHIYEERADTGGDDDDWGGATPGADEESADQ